jgi:DNA-binding NtrC family response regulator
MANKIRLLMVDDEERFLATLKKRLEMRGLEVTAATNGADALEAAAATSFDIALLDLKMPGMDGEEVLARLKERDPHVEVVILTGHGSLESAVRTTKLGSHAYLPKPCETDELLEVLEEACRKRIQRKLRLDKEGLEAFLRSAQGESPLGILRKLRELKETRQES